MPSVKRLDSAFPGRGKALRTLLGSMTAVTDHPAAQALVASCWHYPSIAYQRMTALNATAETHGIESFCDKKGRVIEYLNVGDYYVETLVRFPGGRYRVACVGDIIERHGL